MVRQQDGSFAAQRGDLRFVCCRLDRGAARYRLDADGLTRMFAMSLRDAAHIAARAAAQHAGSP